MAKSEHECTKIDDFSFKCSCEYIGEVEYRCDLSNAIKAHHDEFLGVDRYQLNVPSVVMKNREVVK